MKTMEIGEVVYLGTRDETVSRRTVLKTLAAVGTGTAGLSQTIQRVYGAKPEGVPIVHTTDENGNPDKVRIIPAERHRRLTVYERLPVSKFVDRTEKLTGVSITQRSGDPTDLALTFTLTDNTRSTRKKLPNRYDGVPIRFREQSFEYTPQSVEGGTTLETDDTLDDSNIAGTTTLVAYDQTTGDEVLITADHVTWNNDKVYDTNGTLLAQNQTYDTATDTSKYQIEDGVSTDALGTIDVPDVTGTWKFAGLADKVGQTDDGDSVSDGDTVPVQLYGATSDRIDDKCNNTKRYGKDRGGRDLEYQADMYGDDTRSGDSGAPWVDDNGKLLACHYGISTYYTTSWSIGTVGYESLNRVGATISS